MRTQDMLRAARRDGKAAGLSCASWVEYRDAEATRAMLKGIEDGDPAVLDSLREPNLSGEWAGDPTPQSLAEDYELGADRDPDGWRLDAACSEWEEAARSAFWAEVERSARYYAAEGR